MLFKPVMKFIRHIFLFLALCMSYAGNLHGQINTEQVLRIGQNSLYLDVYKRQMEEGIPEKCPAAVVDLDDTPVSRNVIRNLGASQLADIRYKPSSYAEAMDLVKEGKIFGFFMIPRGFQEDAVSGRETTITYYSNMAYFVPGTLSFKAFKQTAVTTSGGIAMTTLVRCV